MSKDTIEITERQNDVLDLILKGYSNREIAHTLVISLDTVKAHLQTMFRKFDVKSRSQLILKALGKI